MAREAGTPATLNELFGKEQSLSLEGLSGIFGEQMPELPFDRVGKLRLQRALETRFGMNWRSLPGMQDLLKEFDSETKMKDIIKLNTGESDGIFK